MRHWPAEEIEADRERFKRMVDAKLLRALKWPSEAEERNDHAMGMARKWVERKRRREQ